MEKTDDFIDDFIKEIRFIYDGSSLCRWNDQNRNDGGFAEPDKHGHKMSIATYIGKRLEAKGIKIDWQTLYFGCFYEYLFKCWHTDLRPPAAAILKENFAESVKAARKALSEKYGFPEDICREFEEYLLTDYQSSLEKQILDAASKLATHWEYHQVAACNTLTPDLITRGQEIEANVRKLPLAVEMLEDPDFIAYNEILGQLRKQKRWTRLDILVRTTDIGHEYMVAMMSLLFARYLKICDKGIENLVMTALLHDHPEAFTGDVPTTVKDCTPFFRERLHQEEEKYIKTTFLPLFPESQRENVFLWTFSNSRDTIVLDGKRVDLENKEDILNYNEDIYSPILGRLAKICDTLSGFYEAYVSIESGIRPRELRNAFERYYQQNKDLKLYGIDFGKIFRTLWEDAYSH